MNLFLRKAVFVSSFLLSIAVSVRAQRITLSLRNVSVTTAMSQLQKNSGYSFVYNSKDIKGSRLVSVTANNKPISEVVAQILEGQGVDYVIRNKSIIISPKSAKEQQQGQKKTRLLAGH